MTNAEKRIEKEAVLMEMKGWLVSISSWSEDSELSVEIPDWLKEKIDILEDKYESLRTD